MSKSSPSGDNFIGYEYRDIAIDRSMIPMYVDGYQNFGWILEGTSSSQIGLNNIILKFKRDRKIRNKAELTRLQRQFDACINEISSMEKSKTSNASVVAFTVGLIGTALLAGAVFSFVGGLIVLCIILSLLGFVGWIIPYFLYNSVYAKKAAKISHLIDSKYDEIYEVCKRANELI